MRCPFCKATQDRVLDTRTNSQGTLARRRRECLKCSRRFTTYERVEIAPRMVKKTSDRRELFNREKILRGVEKACDKRNIPIKELEKLVEQVEAKIYDRYEKEVSARAIGELVSEALSKLDPVAYVRFASVYRRFEDVQGFEKLLQTLSAKDCRYGKAH